jgi:hypothetical protein
MTHLRKGRPSLRNGLVDGFLDTPYNVRIWFPFRGPCQLNTTLALADDDDWRR